MSSRHWGFTLLEILLVMLILGIGMAAIAPVAIQTVGVARTRSALRKTIALHHYGRTRAMRGHETLVMSYDPENGQVQLMSSISSENPDEGSDSTPERWLPMPAADVAPEEWSLVRSVELPSSLRIDRIAGLNDEGSVTTLTLTRNGSTPSYSVELVDTRGDRYTLQFDGISGHVDLKP